MLPLHTHGKIERLKKNDIYKVLESFEIEETHVERKNILVFLKKNKGDMIADLIKQGISGFILEDGATLLHDSELIVVKKLRNPEVVKPGDVISLRTNSSLISVLFRRGANANTLFVPTPATEKYDAPLRYALPQQPALPHQNTQC